MGKLWNRLLLASVLLVAVSAAGCAGCDPFGSPNGGSGYHPQGFADHQ